MRIGGRIAAWLGIMLVPPLITPVMARDSVSVGVTNTTSVHTHGVRLRLRGKARETVSRHKVTVVVNAAAAATPPTLRSDERLDNAGVLALTRAGLGEPAIVAKIHATTPAFDITTDTLIGLRHAGVTSAVIAAMIEAQSTVPAHPPSPDSPDPAAPHPAGVYVLASWLDPPKMLAMRASAASRTRAGNILGYALTAGVAPVAYRAIVPAPHATMVAGTARPSFFIVAGTSSNDDLPQPDDITLVRFAPQGSGRAVRIGSFTLAGASTGIRPQDAIGFSAATVAPGVVALRPDHDLAPGEYGFITVTEGSGPGGAKVATASARVFDFAVASAAEGSREGAWGSAAGTVTAGDSDSAEEGAVAAALTISDRTSHRRKARVKEPKEPQSSPSLYPGGK